MNPKLPLCLALGLSGFNAHAQPDLSARNDATIAAIRKTGVPTTSAELNAWYPSVPEEQNAATVYAEAFALLPEKSSAPLPPVDQSQKILASLHSGAARTACRYPVDFTQGLLTKIPHLAKVKLGARLLAQETILAAGKNQMDLALESVLAGLALDRSLEKEPLILSQIIRTSSIEVTIGGLEQSLWHKTYSEEQLVRLQAALETAEDNNAPAYERALIGERCQALAVFRLPPEQLGPFIEDVAGQATPDVPTAHDAAFDQLLENYAKGPALKADLDFYLNQMQAAIAIAKAKFPDSLNQADAWKSEVNGAMAKNISYCLLPALGLVPQDSATGVAELRVAQTIMALERYRLAHKKNLPDSLNQLVPEYLKLVPVDPFDGAPLRFKIIPRRGYMVYSIGKDRQDDGGIHKPAMPLAHSHYDLAVTVLCDLSPNQSDTTVVSSLTQTKTRTALDPRILKSQQNLADKGDAYGELRMGLRYRDGDGMPQDLDKAREWLQKAAAQGDAEAAGALAKLPAPVREPAPISPPSETNTNSPAITVLSAEFGEGKNVSDVTARVAELLRTQPDGFTVNADTLGADPLPGKKKRLVVKYDYQGASHVLTIPGGKHLDQQALVNNAGK